MVGSYECVKLQQSELKHLVSDRCYIECNTHREGYTFMYLLALEVTANICLDEPCRYGDMEDKEV